MESTDQKLLNVLRAAVYDVNLKDIEDLSAATRLSELGLDSVAMMEVIGVLEENLSIRITDEEVASLGKVGDLLNLMQRKIPAELNLAQENPQRFEDPMPPQMADNPECWDMARYPEIESIVDRLAGIEAAGLRNPYFHVHEGTARNTSIVDGTEMLNFSSYNYLGFSGHPEVVAAAKDAIDRYGTSVSASRPVSGERQIHRDLEKGIADLIGAEDAIAYVSGHATNVTTIGHLFDKNDLIVHDSLCHDSILQGIHLSGAKRLPFRHADMADLERILSQVRNQYRRTLICSEGLFSMDGDICDLPSLIGLKKRFRCNLLIDEAHSVGVLGPAGQGVAHHFPGIDPADVELWMGTLSKSLSSCGGYIAGIKSLILYLKFTAPGFLYSVGMSPPNAAAAHKSLQLMQQHPEIVERLRQRSKLFLELAQNGGIQTGLAVGAAVIPAIIGNSIQCMQLSQALAGRKINVQPIVHPAVEEDAARLRFFISATHTEEEIRYTVKALSEEWKKIRHN